MTNAERPLIVTAAQARAAIAHAMLGEPPVPEQLGRVILRARQRSIAARLLAQLQSDGGAMLSEPVGLGKTYAALAVACAMNKPFCVIAPASLVDMWSNALTETELGAAVVSHESLSRGRRPPDSDLYVVDEAHRFRNAGARRYALLADVCRRARLLLVSATPIHNRRGDLAAQLGLFLGRRAWSMSEAELAAHVVRGTDEIHASVPRQIGPLPVAIDGDDACLAQIAALAPPVPARDESVAAALLTYGLIHQWTSSRAALVEALRRRRTRGLAMLDALEAGRAPTRIELAAWTHGSDAMQLAFPELMVAPSSGDADLSALAVGVDRHLAGVEALLATCRRAPDPDLSRAKALREICSRHPAERVIAFCHYAETVVALFAHLRQTPGVATLTARGATLSSGRVSRAHVLAQFSPRGDRPDVRDADRIALLITTDLLSEGVNLQEASVVVHLDLPWNPARLEQRVGRVRRLGSRHPSITVYSFSPPAAADRLLRLESRLHEKIGIAQRTVGVAGSILPSVVASHARPQSDFRASIDDRMRAWLMHPAPPGSTRPVIGATRSSVRGFIAAVRCGDEARLVVDANGTVSESADAVAATLDSASGDDASVDPFQMQCAFDRIRTYCDERRASTTIDLGAIAAAKSRRDALTRVSRALARAPRHRRSELAPIAEAARAVATIPLGEGAERILDVLIRSDLPDEAWLRSIAAFSEVNARPDPGTRRPHGDSVILAVLLLQPAL